MTRKSFSGNATPTTLTSSMLAGDATFSVGATTNWPNTATGPFVVTIDRGLNTEEKILCSSYTSLTVTVASSGRGYDGTTAQGHANGATVNCTIDANTIDGHDAFVAGNGTVTPSTSAVGDAATNGTSTKPAAGDHKHARESFATVTTTSAVGDAKNDGASVSPARADHKHAREAFGTDITASSPSDTVNNGSGTTVAHSNHTHGRESRAGVVEMFAAASAPTGALLCQGQAVSRTTYSGLFSVIGTTWGSGDGSTTFNVPDFRSVSPIGAGTGVQTGTTARAQATFYGAETVTISSSQLPSHTHNVTSSGSGNTGTENQNHTHSFPGSQITTTTGSSSLYEASSGPQPVTNNGSLTSSQDSQTHIHPFSVTVTGTTDGGTGAGAATSILQPVLAINFIIWTI